MKKIFYSMAVLMMGLSFTACSSDDDNKNDETDFNVTETTPVVDADSYSANTTAANFSVKSFGESAVDGCADISLLRLRRLICARYSRILLAM